MEVGKTHGAVWTVDDEEFKKKRNLRVYVGGMGEGGEGRGEARSREGEVMSQVYLARACACFGNCFYSERMMLWCISNQTSMAGGCVG